MRVEKKFVRSYERISEVFLLRNKHIGNHLLGYWTSSWRSVGVGNVRTSEEGTGCERPDKQVRRHLGRRMSKRSIGKLSVTSETVFRLVINGPRPLPSLLPQLTLLLSPCKSPLPLQSSELTSLPVCSSVLNNLREAGHPRKVPHSYFGVITTKIFYHSGVEDRTSQTHGL